MNSSAETPYKLEQINYVHPKIDVGLLYPNGKLLSKEMIEQLEKELAAKKDGKYKIAKIDAYAYRFFRKNYSILYLDGELFALYDYKKTLGKGSFGVVKLAQNLKTGEWVAVKTLKQEEHYSTKKMNSSGDQEKKNLSEALNANILTQRRKNKASSARYDLVMPLAKGISLDHLIYNERKIDTHLYLDLLIKLMNQVNDLHQNGQMLHRDIKPDNVIVDLIEEKILLIDFGLAVKMDEQTKDIQFSSFSGTLNFSPPEYKKHVLEIKKISNEIQKLEKKLASINFHIRQLQVKEQRYQKKPSVLKNYENKFKQIQEEIINSKNKSNNIINDINKEKEKLKRINFTYNPQTDAYSLGKTIQESLALCEDENVKQEISNIIKTLVNQNPQERKKTLDACIKELMELKESYLQSRQYIKKVAYLNVADFLTASYAEQKKMIATFKKMDKVWLYDTAPRNNLDYVKIKRHLELQGIVVREHIIQINLDKNIDEALRSYEHNREEKDQRRVYHCFYVDKNGTDVLVKEITQEQVQKIINNLNEDAKRLEEIDQKNHSQNNNGRLQAIQNTINHIESRQETGKLTFSEVYHLLDSLQLELQKQRKASQIKILLEKTGFSIFMSKTRQNVLAAKEELAENSRSSIKAQLLK